MTSDDTNTAGESEEGDKAPDDAKRDVPPRDPETGKFLPRNERPDAPTSDDGPTDGAEREPNADKRDPEPMSEESDSEPTADEDASESSTGAGAPNTELPATPDGEGDAGDETAVTEQPSDETSEESQPEPTAPERGAAPTPPHSGGREAESPSDQELGAVFLTNPNGYPRPATTFLPSHPWLRLPSRLPAHETVSSRG